MGSEQHGGGNWHAEKGEGIPALGAASPAGPGGQGVGPSATLPQRAVGT